MSSTPTPVARGPVACGPLARGPIARSPIAPAPPVSEHGGWEVSGRRSTAELTVADATPLAKVAVRAAHDGGMRAALGVPFGRAARDAGGRLVVGSGPGEWLVLAGVGESSAARAQLAEAAADVGELVSVVDLTHGRALVRLTGACSADLLAKVCGIDLAPSVTPDGTAFRSSVAGVVTDVVRDDAGPVASYLLHCERSSGQYLFDRLLDAGAEFAIETTGFSSPGT